MSEKAPTKGKHLAILAVFILVAVATAVGFFYMKHARFPSLADLWGN